MNNLAPGYSPFEDPLSHLDWGAANSHHSSPRGKYIQTKNPLTQAEINKARELLDDRMGVDEEEV